MTPFEKDKRKRNLADGYKETKGLKGGHCNRFRCQAPLSLPDGTLLQQSWMIDHERFTGEGRLYYCHPCTIRFNKADDDFRQPRRCTMLEA